MTTAAEPEDQATGSDEINGLMDRCLAVYRRCRTTDDFNTIYKPSWGDPHTRGWYVGFYEHEYGKQVAEGETLVEALTNWLEEYELALPSDTVPS